MENLEQDYLTIANNVPKVYEAGWKKVLDNAESLNGKLQGAVVKATDVANIEHNIPCRVESKNLFDISVARKGYFNGNTGVFLSHSNNISSDYIIAKGNQYYTASANEVFLIIGIAFFDENKTFISKNSRYSVNSYTVCTPINTRYIVVNYNYNEVDMNLDTFNDYEPQIELGSTATPYTPYITDFSQVEVSRYGKNIFDDTKIKSGFAPQSGAYPISNSSYPNSQYFELNVYAGQTIYFSVKDGGYTKGRARYALNGEALGPITKGDNLGYLTASESQNNGFENGCFQIKKDCTLVFMFLEGLVDIQMQIEYGNKQTDYEPCKKQIYTSTADGVVNGITSIAPNMTVLTDTEGVVINANYYKDPDIVISNLAQSVALSGGEG